MKYLVPKGTSVELGKNFATGKGESFQGRMRTPQSGVEEGEREDRAGLRKKKLGFTCLGRSGPIQLLRRPLAHRRNHSLPGEGVACPRRGGKNE